MSEMLKPLKVFYLYAHEDEKLKKRLDKHLSILKASGVITEWHDRNITPATEEDQEISQHVNSADLILPLVSADFLASRYCYGAEMLRALERHEAGEARVIPIILRAADWEGAPFGYLQALPTNSQPVTSWSNEDEAFLEVAKGIRKTATELQPNPPLAQRILLAPRR